MSNWSEQEKQQFPDNLVTWYEDEKRELPWRENRDPYRVWVSEIMLQQTQVDTVIPYFERFMTLFPTMHIFAEAPEELILKAWEGLGYYSRVRNLQTAMKEVVELYDGIVPTDKETVLALKGVGPYTAGAILSIAYNQPEPAVDGNVYRVYSRLMEIEDDIAKAKTRKVFEKVVAETISQTNPGAFNQALMDLGATICTPKNPKCAACPVAQYCRSHASGTMLNFPVKTKKIKTKQRYLVTAIIQNNAGEILVQQRPETGLLANMWMFPSIEADKPFADLATSFKIGLDLPVYVNQESLGQVKHVFSHLKWEVETLTGIITTDEFKLPENYRFVSITAMKHLPFPVPYQKVWQLYLKTRSGMRDE
ncbi:A/G-specific adenine glycosylase [Brochothrix campestris]|nr:A/G-specific adenine glycosylase [Brochothrix campestris]